VAGRTTLIAFIAIVVFGGFNGIAVKFSNQDLAPLWGATLRFAAASLLLFGIVALQRTTLPRGQALIGSILYGLLGFAGSYAFVYWGLVEAPAGAAVVILALVPLLTLLLAVLQGLERFRWQGLLGALVSVAGIVIVFGDRLGADVPLPSMLAILAGGVCMAETNVVVKRFPKGNPVANNAIAMGIGAIVLLILSVVSGSPLGLPVSVDSWLAVVYLVTIGSVVLFMLYLYVIDRWTASATSYVLLLMPLVAVPAAAFILGEAVTPAFVVGGLIAMAGVYLGAFAPSLARPLPLLGPRPVAVPAGPTPAGPPECTTIGCP